jgi:O-acetyl-ADP-ribose deacetylase (regulator of RNase III)
MITYVIGDATHPIPIDGHRYIVHCCNDKGGWGSGFVLALNKVSPLPRERYLHWFNTEGILFLGDIQYVDLDRTTTVVNLIGQHGTKADREHPIRYDAIYDGLTKLAEAARIRGGTIHMPRMGAGLAGGSWPVIEAIIEETCPDVHVYVYDLAKEAL